MTPKASPTVWSLGTDIALPHDFAWLQFDGIIHNSREREPLDVSLAYNAPKGKATIYVYGSCAPDDSEAIAAEAQRVVAAVIGANPDVKTPWPFSNHGPLYGRVFLVGDKIGFAGVSAMGGKFVKVRLTFDDQDEISREMSGQCVGAISHAVEGRRASWIGA